jgi:hypothetical protein
MYIILEIIPVKHVQGYGTGLFIFLIFSDNKMKEGLSPKGPREPKRLFAFLGRLL